MEKKLVEWNPSDSTQYQTYSNGYLSLNEISSNSSRSSRKLKSKSIASLSCLEWSTGKHEPSSWLAYGNTTGTVFAYNWSTEEEVSPIPCFMLSQRQSSIICYHG